MKIPASSKTYSCCVSGTLIEGLFPSFWYTTLEFRERLQASFRLDHDLFAVRQENRHGHKVIRHLMQEILQQQCFYAARVMVCAAICFHFFRR
jgi:hypothetical protein